jgi:hypothetical protein
LCLDIYYMFVSGKWFLLKKYLFMLLLILRKWQAKKKQLVQESGPGYGMKSHSSIEEMECPQQLRSDEMVMKHCILT